VIALDAEGERDGFPLLRAAMIGGRRIDAPLSLNAIRAHAQDQLSTLPDRWRSLAPAHPFPVRPSTALESMVARMNVQQH
jgi:hypothetical protein